MADMNIRKDKVFYVEDFYSVLAESDLRDYLYEPKYSKWHIEEERAAAAAKAVRHHAARPSQMNHFSLGTTGGVCLSECRWKLKWSR